MKSYEIIIRWNARSTSGLKDIQIFNIGNDTDAENFTQKQKIKWSKEKNVKKEE